MATSLDMTVLAQTWEVAAKVIDMGKVELCIFVVTLVLALIARSTRGVGGDTKKKLVSRAVMPKVSRVSAAKSSPTTNMVAQLAEDAISMRCSTVKVLARYAAFKASSQLPNIERDLVAASSPHTVSSFYQSLVQCACRGSQPELVASLFDDMAAIGCPRSVEVYESAMRLLAANRCFKEALSVNDRLERDGLTASAVTKSCLVSFSAELGLDDKTIYFFERLCESGSPPSVRACMVILRVHAKRQDWPASVACLRSMLDSGAGVDGVCLNVVLATGVAAGKVDEAQALLSNTTVAHILDTISYNTVLKGLAQKGSVDKASRLFDSLGKQGVQPNVITFNTIIDAAVRAQRIDEAWRRYDQMCQSAAVKPDKCTCSTLVKALQQKPTPYQVDRVLELVGCVVAGCQKDLAGRLLSTTLFAALRISDLKLALRAKAMITEQGFTLSEADLRSIAQLQVRQ
jgi:pentatricopeptide repeat protein